MPIFHSFKNGYFLTLCARTNINTDIYPWQSDRTVENATSHNGIINVETAGIACKDHIHLRQEVVDGDGNTGLSQISYLTGGTVGRPHVGTNERRGPAR